MMLTWFCMMACVAMVSAYPSGAPSGACGTMKPSHGTNDFRTSTTEYIVSFSSSTYTPGEPIQVTLSGTGGNQFRGFLIQPRKSTDHNGITTYGSISNVPSNTRNLCDPKAALTHNSNAAKTSIQFTWTPPSTDEGNIVFVYTIVKTKLEIWLKLQSSALTYKASPQGPTDAPTQAPTQGPTDAPTNPPTPGKITRDIACDKTIGCFPGLSVCSTDCDYVVTWNNTGADDVEFTVQRKTSSNNYFIAIGFSADPKMGNDSVTECVSFDGSVEVRSSYNPGKYNDKFANSVFGVTKISASYSDGILSCTFLRKKTAALASGIQGRKKRAVADEKTFFDLNIEWYLLVAHGSASSGDLRKHTETPNISPRKIDFQAVSTPETTTPSQSDKGAIQSNSECGKSLGCFRDCKGKTCSYLLTWKDMGDVIKFTVACKRSGNVYCAIGLSADDKMGDDSVFECVSTDGSVSASVSYNEKGIRNNEPLDDPTFGLDFISGSHIDGVLRCDFTRKKTAALASAVTSRKKRAAASASNYFDMSTNWYLLFAYGTSTGGFINKHAVTPDISSTKADFQSFDDLAGTQATRLWKQLHGILMTVAWVFLATIGMFMPSFYKCVWPEGMEWCGQKRWFVVHRMCMVLVFLCTATSFVIIFVHVGGYAQIDGSNFEKSHPIIGIVVMCLTLTNPIMATFRPHPGTPKRPLFNVAHTLVGVSAYVCGIVNIFSGIMLAAINLPDYPRIIMYVFVGWNFLISVICHIYDYTRRKGSKGEMYEMRDPADSSSKTADNDGQIQTFKTIILPIHILVVLGLATAVAVVIGVAEKTQG